MTAATTSKSSATHQTLNPLTQAAYLAREWALMFRPSTILADAQASVAVALVALPLSLAIAAASGVPPEVGLITAVVGGIVVALFGGCRLQVSGPAAAMTFLVLEIVTNHGMAGLIAATLFAGILQVVAGMLRVGRFMQFIPRPVIAGFLSGIGLTILCTQAPVILGYSVLHSNEEGGAVALAWKTIREINRAQPTTLLVGLTAMTLMIILPRLSRKLPTPLIAVIVASILPFALGWKDVELLGTLPSTFPAPRIPVMPWGEWNELVLAGLTIFLLASIESLLSASVVDAMAKQRKVDNDQELVGQGLANMASACFGGIPVTGVIARSATNIQAGARTRLSAILHALLVLAAMLVLSEYTALIPKAALSGVLCAVAFRMVETHMFRSLWSGSRPEALVFLVTTGAIIVTDLIDGVQVGLIATVLYFVYEMSNLDIRPLSLTRDGNDANNENDDREAVRCRQVRVLEVEGPLFFASGFHLRNLISRLEQCQFAVIDMQGISFLDVTGAEILEEGVEQLASRGVSVILAGPTPVVRGRLRSLSKRQFRTLQNCPMYDNLRDALLHVAALVEPSTLCSDCVPDGQCKHLKSVLTRLGTIDRTPVPQVRAVLSGANEGTSQEQPGRKLSPLSAIMGKEGASPLLGRKPPRVDPEALVDEAAKISGPVTVAAGATISADVTIRADENPFYIDRDACLQGGVMIHSLPGKVVLVKGKPFAVYLGQRTTCAHQSLIHGPCYVGDDCLIGFKSTIHDAVLGEGCVVGHGATVIGVNVPPHRWVAHHLVVDTQEKADHLPVVDFAPGRIVGSPNFNAEPADD